MKMKYLFLACGMAALFAACQNENEPKVVSDKPGTSGDYRIIIEGEETDAQTSRSSGTIQFVGGTASGAGLYDGVGRAFVSATPDPGYEINYFYGGPDSEPKKYDNANGGATSFDVPINGQDHLFHVGFKEKTGTLTINAGTGGTVSPSGQVAIQREVPFSIKATPNSGYEFTGWTVNSGNVTIANASSTSTTATLNSSSGTITANFSKSAPTIPTYELYIEATPIGNRVKLKLYINYGGALVTTWPFKEDNLSFKINLRDRSDASKRFELSAGSINYSKYSCSGTTTYSFECASGYNFKSPYVESVVFNSQPDGAIVKFIQR